MGLKLYNTFAREVQEIKPIKNKKIGLYTCGQTVYGPPHIGNMRKYIFDDVLRRSLEFLGYKVKHVMNVTDVGHLTSDEDEGEDKIEKGAKREQKTVWQVAEEYTDLFLKDSKDLNLLPSDILAKATDHIPEMIKMVEVLLEKDYAYETPEAVYFDVSKFPRYAELTGQKLAEKVVGARQEVVTETSKKHSADFALWFKTVGRFANHTMHWDSPWGEGFPGWHIECSAIGSKYLGQPFDIHTGGIDHISVHHPNEIAQSEAAHDKPLANYWLHSEHLLVEGGKMAKSKGNLFTLANLKEKGFSPLDFRYLVLTSHYQNKLNFTWEGLAASARAYSNLKTELANYEKPTKPDKNYLEKFTRHLENNLDTPSALALLWQLVKDEKVDSAAKRATINEMDKVFGLNLSDVKPIKISAKVKKLVEERDAARAQKNFQKSDELREQIEAEGYAVEDTAKGTRAKKI